VKRFDIPAVLDRGISVASPNKVGCGGITYVWAEGRCHYLAAVINLYARRVVGWTYSAKPATDLVIKALDKAYEQHGRPQNMLFHSDQALEKQISNDISRYHKIFIILNYLAI
jgi:putative transposase